MGEYIDDDEGTSKGEIGSDDENDSDEESPLLKKT